MMGARPTSAGAREASAAVASRMALLPPAPLLLPTLEVVARVGHAASCDRCPPAVNSISKVVLPSSSSSSSAQSSVAADGRCSVVTDAAGASSSSSSPGRITSSALDVITHSAGPSMRRKSSAPWTACRARLTNWRASKSSKPNTQFPSGARNAEQSVCRPASASMTAWQQTGSASCKPTASAMEKESDGEKAAVLASKRCRVTAWLVR